MSALKGWMLVALAFVLSACGGGGGDSGSNGSVTGGGTTTGSPSLSVSVVDSTGNTTTNIDFSGGYKARAVLRDAKGVVVNSKLVTFTLAGGIAVLTPSTALTDAGVAEVGISPASVASQGATTLKAVATINGTAVEGEADFAVQSASVSLSPVRLGSNSLLTAGNTSVAVTASIAGVAAGSTPVLVNFSTTCGRINGRNAVDSPVSVTTDGSGVASASYDAVSASGSSCSGNVTVTATTAGAPPVSATLAVAAPVAESIVFIGASPEQIFIAGSGAIDKSTVTFKVLSNANAALGNVPVSFTLVNNSTGVTLSSPTGTTNSNGEVSVSVFSGTLPGPVKVRATLNSNTFAESQNLTVASGPPSQRFMSLAVETFNIEGHERDGTPTVLTARVADRQGNPVQDGTVVNFTAEAGQVARSCTTSAASGISKCSVLFESQNPRPVDGRVSVLAYLEGTDDYLDNDSSNSYTAGDTLRDQGHAFRDDNEDDVYQLTELSIPRGGSLTCSGAGDSQPTVANTCDGLLSTTVRKQAVILFASSHPVDPTVGPSTLSPTLIEFDLRSVNNPLLPMPAGTTLQATPSDQTSANGLTCTVVRISGSPVINVVPGNSPAEDLATSHAIELKDCATGDRVLLDVDTPSGVNSSYSFSLP